MNNPLLEAEDWDEMYSHLLVLTSPVVQAAGKHGKTIKEKEDSLELALSLNLLLSYFKARKQAPYQQDQELFQARINHNFETLSKELLYDLSNK